MFYLIIIITWLLYFILYKVYYFYFYKLFIILINIITQNSIDILFNIFTPFDEI